LQGLLRGIDQKAKLEAQRQDCGDLDKNGQQQSVEEVAKMVAFLVVPAITDNLHSK